MASAQADVNPRKDVQPLGLLPWKYGCGELEENRCTIKMAVPNESFPPTRDDFRCLFAVHCSCDGLHDTRRAYEFRGDGVLQADGNRVRKHGHVSFS